MEIRYIHYFLFEIFLLLNKKNVSDNSSRAKNSNRNLGSLFFINLARVRFSFEDFFFKFA